MVNLEDVGMVSSSREDDVSFKAALVQEPMDSNVREENHMILPWICVEPTEEFVLRG